MPSGVAHREPTRTLALDPAWPAAVIVWSPGCQGSRLAPDRRSRPGSPARRPAVVDSLLDRLGVEITLPGENPVLRGLVVLVVRDRVLRRVAILVQPDLAEDGVVRVARVGDVRPDLLAERAKVRDARADFLQRLDQDLDARV